MSDKKANPMREVRVAKLTLNICTGESGDRLQKAAKVRFAVQRSLFGPYQAAAAAVPMCNGVLPLITFGSLS
jgi:hypothetical protein